MSKSAQQISVLTANRLGDGAVVFLDGNGDWAEGISAAAVARAPEEVRALEARGAHDAARNLVLDVYLVEVRETASGPAPVRMRERVRVAGPSILGDVPGYVSPASPPSPRGPKGVRPLAPDPSASRYCRGEGSDPFPAKSGERESRAPATEAA